MTDDPIQWTPSTAVAALREYALYEHADRLEQYIADDTRLVARFEANATAEDDVRARLAALQEAVFRLLYSSNPVSFEVRCLITDALARSREETPT